MPPIVKAFTGSGSAPSSGLVAVVVPVYRPEVLPDERVALAHLRRFLGRYPLFTVQPAGLGPVLTGFTRVTFADRWFTGTDTYNRLLVTPAFYRPFAGFDYLLIHQLDALVFSDALETWCRAGYDFIGAPLFNRPQDPASGFSHVRNGGLSLRRVSRHRAVLRSRKAVYPRAPTTGPVAALAARGREALKRAVGLTDVRWRARHMLNEDVFWTEEAPLFDPGFRIPDARTSLQFAMECHPRHCYEQNGRQLPFGCHAWATYDRAFWEPFLLPDAAKETA